MKKVIQKVVNLLNTFPPLSVHLTQRIEGSLRVDALSDTFGNEFFGGAGRF